MMDAVLPTLSALIQCFFQDHLIVERNASPNTVLAYRDSMKLFLGYASRMRGCSPDELGHEAFDAPTVRAFLMHLIDERGSGARTRNQRLAALKAFAKYVGSVAPEHLDRSQRVRQIAPARIAHREAQYLDEDEVAQILDSRHGLSRRDRAMLLFLYNTGARVQELVDLDVDDFQLQPLPLIHLVGKGRKQRTCPLWSRTAAALQEWLAEREVVSPRAPLFLNARGQRFSRSGVAHVLRVAGRRASLEPRHAARVTPHVVRHTTAMHLLRSGVDITTIAAWLGHAQLTTTHGYVEIDLRMKAAAIAAATPPAGLKPRKYPAPDLINWLEDLRVRAASNYVQPKPSTSTRTNRSSA
jgi:integrase/recombinase XerD